MRDLSTLTHNAESEKIVTILMNKTQNPNPLFFRILVAYNFCKVASMMRCFVDTHDRDAIPVNMYALNLANSGFGKGFSTNIIEDRVLRGFKEQFLQQTFPANAQLQLEKLALKRSSRNATLYDAELDIIENEFNELGNLAFSFDSATTPAVKQMRYKLLMANAGSMNMEIDEIGSNLLGNVEVLTTFLELFDVGKVKQKLTKNTKESFRNEELDGNTPTNLMMFGTQSKLLNGAKQEEELDSMLETGYARRCFFGFSKSFVKAKVLTAAEVYDMATQTNIDQDLLLLENKFTKLADPIYFNQHITMTKDVALILIEYKLHCEARANKFTYHEETKKAEMIHRYFKVLKLAGAYAFVEASPEITEDILYNAIKLAEDSGEAFTELLTRDKAYVKLAKHIATIGREVTQADLVEDLPFYRGSESQKREMMSLAVAYGNKHNILIRRTYTEGIEFLRGETIQETDLDNMIISYGKFAAEGYRNEYVAFNDLHKLINQPDYNWVNHHLEDLQS